MEPDLLDVVDGLARDHEALALVLAAHVAVEAEPVETGEDAPVIDGVLLALLGDLPELAVEGLDPRQVLVQGLQGRVLVSGGLHVVEVLQRVLDQPIVVVLVYVSVVVGT